MRTVVYFSPPPPTQSPCFTALEKTDSIGWSFKVEVYSTNSIANGRLEYSIEQGNEDGTFNIDSQTGTITLAKDLDFAL